MSDPLDERLEKLMDAAGIDREALAREAAEQREKARQTFRPQPTPRVFPRTEPDYDRHGACVGTVTVDDGISLRDLVALHAMQAVVSRDEWALNQAGRELVAEVAYQLADAMLAERAKGGGSC